MKKVAIITGASSGVGKEFALQIDKLSCVDEIWITARREARLQELSKSLLTETRIFSGDINSENLMQEFSETLASKEYEVKYLVNSAGLGIPDKFINIPLESQLNMIDVNVRSLTWLCQMIIPYMNKGSEIINIASVAAFMPQHEFAVYAATKAYVMNFSRALNSELKSRDIKVIAVCPNPMKTEFFKEIPQGLKKLGFEDVDKVVSKALRRSAKGKELSIQSFMANLIRFISKILPHRFILFFERKFMS